MPGLTGPRAPSAKELKATSVLAMPLAEWSLKVSAGDPDDAEEDLDRDVWAGVVPLEHRWGEPVSAAGVTRPAPAGLAAGPSRG